MRHVSISSSCRESVLSDVLNLPTRVLVDNGEFSPVVDIFSVATELMGIEENAVELKKMFDESQIIFVSRRLFFKLESSSQIRE